MSAGNEPYRILYSKTAVKQTPELKAVGLAHKVQHLINVVRNEPEEDPPSYEKLRGNLAGCLSHRINIHHRLVYLVHKDLHAVRILSMWTHYDALHA